MRLSNEVEAATHMKARFNPYHQSQTQLSVKDINFPTGLMVPVPPQANVATDYTRI